LIRSVFKAYSSLFVRNPFHRRSLQVISLADTALPAFLGAVLAILTILAGFAGIGTCAGSSESVERKLIEEKNRQHNS
jgi:hypothetical protein